MEVPVPPTPSALDRWLAKLLQYGSLLAMSVMACGLGIAFFNPGLGLKVASAGIALLIVLPVLRVLSMLVYFLAKKDYWLGLMSALVLLIILVGYFLGLSKGVRSE